MKNRKVAFAIRELLVVLVIMSVLICFLYPALKASRGMGDSRLKELPNEMNREYHPNGMSIIRPGDWKTGMVTSGTDLDKIEFLGGTSLRYPCRIWLFSAMTDEKNTIPSAFERTIQPEKYKETVFQDEPAYEHIEQKRRDSMEDPAYAKGDLYFFRGQRCYLIRYLFYNSEATAPENLHLYLSSFRPTNDQDESKKEQGH